MPTRTRISVDWWKERKTLNRNMNWELSLWKKGRSLRNNSENKNLLLSKKLKQYRLNKPNQHFYRLAKKMVTFLKIPQNPN